MSILNTLALWSIDQELFRAIHIGLHRDFLDRIMLLLSYTGDGHIQIPVILFLAINKKTRTTGLAVIASFILAGGIRLIIKDMVSRPRPSNLEWAHPITWPGGFPSGPNGWLSQTFDVIPYGNSSFPSGHTTTSFAIALIIAWIVYKTEYAWVGWATCIWATLVGLSRIYIGVHYPGDVLAAISLSAVCSTGIYLFWQSKGWLPTHPPSPSETSE
jgi:membrane-associated phospholipid phosphatase